MPQTVNWLPKPDKRDFQAAEDENTDIPCVLV
jgi:hypothetical protein